MSFTKLKYVINFINSEKFYLPLSKLYMLDVEKDGEVLKYQLKRYKKAINRFVEIFGKYSNISIISVPGRTEISGNHTDHNNGLVFSAAVTLDILIIAAKNPDNLIKIYSEEFKKEYDISIDDLNKKQSEVGTSTSLIRGILKGFSDKGFKIGGFNAYLTSDIPEGSGLSSSAAFEVGVSEILNQLYNGGKIDKTEIAKISRYAENIYFEKPCGLMDQLTCCYGGLLKIDFGNLENPEIKKVNCDLSGIEYSLCLVNTGTSHSNLTDEYSMITKEMKAVAGYYNLDNCRGIQYKTFISDIPKLRELYGDRAVLRVLHYLNENKRVDLEVKALQNGDFQTFLKLFKESGDSSFKWLQNIYSCKEINHQGITLALSIAEILFPLDCVARVHGGGFAGTIQLFIKKDVFNKLSEIYKNIFGNNSFYYITIRDLGSILINRLFE